MLKTLFTRVDGARLFIELLAKYVVYHKLIILRAVKILVDQWNEAQLIHAHNLIARKF